MSVPVYITPRVKSQSPGSSRHKPVQRDILYRDNDNILIRSGRFYFSVRNLLAQQSEFAKNRIVNKGCCRTGLGTESPTSKQPN